MIYLDILHNHRISFWHFGRIEESKNRRIKESKEREQSYNTNKPTTNMNHHMNGDGIDTVSLWQLPFASLLVVCSVLQDLQDLINTAATCTAAATFIKSNWKDIKPVDELILKTFLNSLTVFDFTLESGQTIALKKLKETGDIVAVQDPESMIEESVHQIEAGKRFSFPRYHGSIVTGFVLAVDVKEFEINLEIGGATIFKLTSGVSALYVKDGVLDLMQFIRYLVLPSYHDVVIKSSVDMLATMQSCDGYEINTPLTWQVHGIHTQHLRGFDQDQQYTLYFDHVTDYIGVLFEFDTEAKKQQQIMERCVRMFKLTLNTTEVTISGNCCIQKTDDGRVYYKIPIEQKINMSRVDTFSIQIELYRTEGKHFLPNSAIVLTSAQNILAHSNGMMVRYC
jgi:hypothetical protein